MKPLRFHPRVQNDIRDATASYYTTVCLSRSETGFWEELQQKPAEIQSHPEGHHFDESGLRRCNLKRFPYNILFEILRDRIRIQVVRHDSRRPSFGLRRKRY